MQPERKTIQTFKVAGIQVGTSNAQELNPLNAKIPGLWARFMAEGVYNKLAPTSTDGCVYGVYSNFESDANGAYTLTAGRTLAAASQTNYPGVTVESGEYLVFYAHGPRPQVVVSTWLAVWGYFQQHPEIQRSYQSDFECYDGTDGITIHIGIRA